MSWFSPPQGPADRLGLAVVIVGAHCEAPVVEVLRHMVVAASVLAQAVHQQYRASPGAALGQGPVVGGEIFAVAGGEGGQGEISRVGHGVKRRAYWQ